METIKIYVRTDLRTTNGRKVPNGKMASQSAHALMASFLSLFDNKGVYLKIAEGNEKLVEAFLNDKINLEIEPVKSLQDYEKIMSENLKNSIVITDQGRTSFSSPTMTTMAVLPKGYNYIKNSDCSAENNDVYKSKQVIVLNKSQIKDKWDMCYYVSKCSLQFLIELLNESPNKDVISLNNEGLKNWINGAFAKITVKPIEPSFSKTLSDMELAKNNNIFATAFKVNNVVKCVAFGADSIEEIDKYTKDGYSLA